MVSCMPLLKYYVYRATNWRDPMKQIVRKNISWLLALALLSGLTLPAAASEALGEDLTQQEVELHRQTQLTRGVFWSSAYSDLRTEHYITYEPSKQVTPIVTYGEVLREQTTVSASAKKVEAAGYRVVAGINGDFYNTTTGLPIGIVVTEGQLRSSDAGHYAVGFRADGTAVLGKPAVKITADLGYGVDDGFGNYTQLIRQITAVNKSRVSDGGIYLYTHDFNAAHTNGATEPGVDVVCSIADGALAIGGTLHLTVEQVLDQASATPVGKDQVVLSVNLKSNSYYVDALRNIPVGTSITLTAEAADQAWNDVEYAVGALYSLVERGEVVAGLAAGASPRTAVGQKADGTLIFYTIDGRRSGHSVGASLTQVAERLIELGCTTAVCLDGGGSTTLSVTMPDSTAAEVVNTPSGAERAVSNRIFLVASAESSSRLSHFYVEADHDYVLAGSKVNISASAVDSNYIPMNRSYTLRASSGKVDGNVLTTPLAGGEVTVTAQGNSKSGSTTVHAIAEPDHVAVRNSSGTIISELTATPGSVTNLSASAAYNHLSLHADPELFTWTVSGNIGSIDETGKFTAGSPGTGTITVSAGGRSATVEVQVSRIPLKTVEDFETASTVFDGTGNGLQYSLTNAGDFVMRGRQAGKLEYELNMQNGFAAEWRTSALTQINNSVYPSLNLWVYGDGSGNILSFLYSDGTKSFLTKEIAVLDFTGWKQVTVPLADEYFSILGLRIASGEMAYMDDGLGGLMPLYPETACSGTIYIDQIVSAFDGTVDQETPVVTAELDTENWAVTASVSDVVDGMLGKEFITVAFNGQPVEFAYEKETGSVKFYLPGPGESHEAMRVTVTAKDASGNIGRASVDVDALGVDHKFTDIAEYWCATYVDFLYHAGVTTGYADGSFRPNQNITRAQFAVMLYRYLGLDESKYAEVELPFADNGKIAEYAIPAIRALYTEGIINGSAGSDGKLYFNPNNSLTRAQAATMIGRTQEKGYATVELAFSDAARIPAYATYYIQTMAAQGIINGYADGTFKPHNNITRGQMAKILYNLM